LLRFYCEEVVLAYDSDSAGEKATVKAINLLSKEGVAARVLQLPKGMDGKGGDPDEYINEFGADSFETLVEKSGSAVSFELDKLKRAVDFDSPEGRTEYLKKAVALLSDVDSEVDRLVYVSDLANECGVTQEGVRDAIKVNLRKKKSFQAKNEKQKVIRPEVKRDAVNPDSERFPVEEKAERGIIAFLFHSPDKLPAILRNLSPGDFPTAFNRRLFETLVLRLNKRQSLCISSLGGEFSAAEVGRIEKIKIDEANAPFDDERLMDYIKILANHRENKNKKPSDEMTNEEGLEHVRKLKEKFELLAITGK
jgi:DNA primase